jgi:hypothetical protein
MPRFVGKKTRTLWWDVAAIVILVIIVIVVLQLTGTVHFVGLAPGLLPS